MNLIVQLMVLIKKRNKRHLFYVLWPEDHSNINYPLGYFSSCGFDSARLFPVLWDATGILEMAGFKIDTRVSDGVSPNRRFYRLHQLTDGSNLSNDGVV